MKFTIDRLIQIFQLGNSFSHIKLCHGFWEREVLIYSYLEGTNNPGDNELKVAFDKAHDITPTHWPFDMYLELKTYFTNQNNSGVRTFVSEYGWKNSYDIEGTPALGLSKVRNSIQKSFSSSKIYDGLFWKNSIIDGSFTKFIRYIRNKKTLILAPHYNQMFENFVQLKQCTFIEVDPFKAAWERLETLQKVNAYFENNKDTICLIQAGGATSAWLTYNLAKKHPQSSFLCLGQALNICNFEKLEGVNWFMVYRKEICKTIDKINASYISNLNNSYTECRINGYSDALYNNLKTFKVKKESKKISFIESNKVDKKLYNKIIDKFSSINHFANFGPVTKLLEKSLHDSLNLPLNKSVITCKSGTDALMVLAGLEEIKKNQKMKWVISAFGFCSTNIGILSDAIIIDCDKNGMFNLTELDSLEKDLWDGIIVTNIFGVCDNMSRYIDYCNKHGKEIIIDNASALHTLSRKHAHYPNEIVSFHHTKPWGVGEGGIMIVDSKDEQVVRSIINVGKSLNTNFNHLAMNSKMSDFSAALILQRLINLPTWSRLYLLQKRRISLLLKELQINYITSQPDTIMGSLPCLFPSKPRKEKIKNKVIKLEKYYQPLNEDCINAASIYAKMVNIPCHPDLAKIDTEKLKNLLLIINETR